MIQTVLSTPLEILLQIEDTELLFNMEAPTEMSSHKGNVIRRIPKLPETFGFVCARKYITLFIPECTGA